MKTYLPSVLSQGLNLLGQLWLREIREPPRQQASSETGHFPLAALVENKDCGTDAAVFLDSP